MKKYNFRWLKRKNVFGKFMEKYVLNNKGVAELVSVGFWCTKCAEYNEDTTLDSTQECTFCSAKNFVEVNE